SQQRSELELSGTAHVAVEEVAQRQARGLLAQRLYLGLGKADPARAVAPPQEAQHVIERASLLGARADGEVEHERDEAALQVVRLRRVRRVLVGAIELDPRVEAGLFQAVPQSSWGLRELAELFAQAGEVGAWLLEPRAH